MKKYFIVLLIVVSGILMSGCTENTRARSFGGKMTIDLPKNQKLVNATWKETDLWILTKPMDKTDNAESYTFTEKSSFGVLEGTIYINEQK